MNLIEQVRETIRKHSMLRQRDHVLVALSGGPDSVCLLSVLHRLAQEFEIRLHAAYIDHGFRPDETPQERRFCEQFCTALGVPLLTHRIEVKPFAKAEGLSKQEAARELRYRTLDETAAAVNATRIALGHNADDQAETMLMRLLRGTGPSGLAGIPPVRRHIIRPLIETERHRIEAFLSQEGIGFIVDSSNLLDDYLRNRIRHHLLPIMKRMGKDVVPTMARTAAIFRDEERYFDILVTKTLMKLISRKSDLAIELFLVPLESMDTVLVRRVLRRALDETRGLRGIGFAHIEDIIALVRAGASGHRIYLPRGLRAIKGYATLLITAEEPRVLDDYIIEGPGETILKAASLVLRSRILGIDEIDDYGDGKRTALFDADKIAFPLTVRHRMPGDFFYPFGFGKRKKLQDYFVDEKIPRDERDIIPLLVAGEGIAWVVGHRTDARFKIDKTTKRILECSLMQMRR